MTEDSEFQRSEVSTTQRTEDGDQMTKDRKAINYPSIFDSVVVTIQPLFRQNIPDVIGNILSKIMFG